MPICEFSYPTPSVGNIKTHVVVGDINDLIYYDLIIPQFVSQLKVRCLRTFIHPTVFCNQVFENMYYISVEKRKFRDITIQVFDTVGNPIAFKSNKKPAKVVLHFQRVWRAMYINTALTSSTFIPNYGSACTVLST